MVCATAGSPVGTSNIVQVDRSKKLVYPDWVKNIVNPDLADTGPDGFDVGTLEQYLHPKQKEWMGFVKAGDLYRYLVTQELLRGCLGFRECQAIEAQGPDFFRKHFGGKELVFWGGLAHDRGSMQVLTLELVVSSFVTHGYSMESDFTKDNPALRFLTTS